jgi:hypothetical protein
MEGGTRSALFPVLPSRLSKRFLLFGLHRQDEVYLYVVVVGGGQLASCAIVRI